MANICFNSDHLINASTPALQGFHVSTGTPHDLFNYHRPLFSLFFFKSVIYACLCAFKDVPTQIR